MSSIDKLTERFREFPGIGPRQAKRFVYFLLGRNKAYLNELSKLLLQISEEIRSCERCFRFFNGGTKSALCATCRDTSRDKEKLLIVEKDIDLETIDRSGAYKGYYFVLGGTVPILEKEPEKKVRLKELLSRIKEDSKNELKEIIFAFSVNADGEHTVEYMLNTLKDLAAAAQIKLSVLGRGLSTGAEVEYIDSDTIKNALKNRA